jgi:hypothetical protein
MVPCVADSGVPVHCAGWLGGGGTLRRSAAVEGCQGHKDVRPWQRGRDC